MSSSMSTCMILSILRAAGFPDLVSNSYLWNSFTEHPWMLNVPALRNFLSGVCSCKEDMAAFNSLECSCKWTFQHVCHRAARYSLLDHLRARRYTSILKEGIRRCIQSRSTSLGVGTLLRNNRRLNYFCSSCISSTSRYLRSLINVVPYSRTLLTLVLYSIRIVALGRPG